MGSMKTAGCDKWDYMAQSDHACERGPIKVKDMLLKEALEEQKARDARAVEALGGPA